MYYSPIHVSKQEVQADTHENFSEWRTLMRGNDLRMKLLQDTQAQIVLACSKSLFSIQSAAPDAQSQSTYFKPVADPDKRSRRQKAQNIDGISQNELLQPTAPLRDLTCRLIATCGK